jgi:1-acyl-sn-glycerol-3-phosphate acyltransferase
VPPYRPTPEPWTRVAIPIVRALAGVTSRPDYRGRENLPRTGGLLLVANHIANLDPVLLARFVLGLGRIPRFLAKEQLFEKPVLGTLLRGARQIPVHRYRENAAEALSDAVVALRDGELVIIYPEGTFTTDPQGWPMRARNGVARLALAAEVPVVPVAQWGAQTVFGPGLRVRLRRRYSVLAGPAVDISPWSSGTSPSGQALTALTDHVMTRIRAQLAEIRGVPAPAGVWDPDEVR